MPKVTVYIPSHNYGRFLDQAVQSVLRQTMGDWELLIIDDGSTDDTAEVLDQYRGHSKIRIVEQENKGLNVTNNIALRLAAGDYLMRLDADDYLDENILLVLSNVLDTKPEVGLVYPDYYHVDEGGHVFEIVRRKKIGEEVELLDLPAHGAFTMIRKEILLDLGGYLEEFTRQDGYGLWLKFIERYRPYNVNVPLFYYRQHGQNLTRDKELILEARRRIKQLVAEEKSDQQDLRVLGIVPVAAAPFSPLNGPFVHVGGRSLLARTLDELGKARSIDKIAVSCNSQEVLDPAVKFPGVVAIQRPPELARSTSKVEETALHVLETLEGRDGYRPDAVCICYINLPFRRGKHVDKAVDTMKIFGVDSVISIEEDLSFFYHHDRHGLVPLNGSRHRNLRLEREALFKENGAIYLSRCEVIRSGRLLGERVGHVTMLPEESIKINSEFEYWLAEKIAAEWKQRTAGLTG